jgi:hypothetical protein
VARRAPFTRHPLAIVGVLIATASAAVFVAMAVAGLSGMFNNPYAGLVVFLAIPAVFVVGLLLIPLGMWLERKQLRRDPNAVAEWPVLDFRRPEMRRNALLISALTAVNIVIVLLGGYGGLHWMESPGFCGQVCHTPMQPQFDAWQAATHARIACVACHIGEGPAAFVHAKLAGVRQLAHVVTNSYPRPVPPGTDLPPGAQARTCTNCHQPGRAAGDRVKVLREYAEDEKNTETLTVLQMHVNAASPSGRAIHWHADPANRVEFVATGPDRQTIPYVKVTDARGQVKEYVAPDTPEEVIRTGNRRLMECGDCHNAVGHPIAPTAEKAIDQAIAAAGVSRDLPFVRREGLTLLKAAYPSHEVASSAIDQGLRSFYASQGGAPDDQTVARTVAALQDLYRRNVFPTMRVTWGTYPNNGGHFTSNGCFRCHDESHTATDGSTISADCGLCHTQIERP